MKDKALYNYGNIKSTDGSEIGYRKTGSGESLIVLHGAMFNSKYYSELVKSLAEHYTFYLPDRRGRGLSLNADIRNYSIEKEVEDLLELIKQTNAELIFGHSIGGIIALETSFRFKFKKMVLYEPPILIQGKLPVPTYWLPDFNRSINRTDYYKALSIAIKGFEMGPLANKPTWLIGMILRLSLWGTIRKDAFEAMKMLGKEFEIVENINPDLNRYRNNKTQTLLINGTETKNFGICLEILSKFMLNSERLALDGYDHNTLKFGDTGKLCHELNTFLRQ